MQSKFAMRMTMDTETNITEITKFARGIRSTLSSTS